jgi:hypothetical protein
MADKAVDGVEGRGLYPAPHRKRGGFRAGTDAADKPVERPICPRMFDIVNGRETRAAVLLAASRLAQASLDA